MIMVLTTEVRPSDLTDVVTHDLQVINGVRRDLTDNHWSEA